MEMPRLSQSVISAVRLEKDASGGFKPVVIYQKPQRKKKKESPAVKLVDKSLRRMIKAQKSFLDRYMSLHDQSNSKKKDGWVIDLAPNLATAGRTGVKKLKLDRLPLM